MKRQLVLSAMMALGVAASVHAGTDGSGSGEADMLVCGDDPAPTAREVFIALPDPNVAPTGKPFVSQPVVQVCDVDTITWYGPDEFTIEFDDPAGPPVERLPEQAQAAVQNAGAGFPSNGKGKVALKVRKDAEKHKLFKYSVTVPGHDVLDPGVIVRNAH